LRPNSRLDFADPRLAYTKRLTEFALRELGLAPHLPDKSTCAECCAKFGVAVLHIYSRDDAIERTSQFRPAGNTRLRWPALGFGLFDAAFITHTK
jgi:hypothetical protein